ncbi:MAG: hypothetical protein IPJ32_05425 [Sphingobacteriaceae bacterium]|nr:hypothetical protein [Sphingobacteriaceae bacterium]
MFRTKEHLFRLEYGKALQVCDSNIFLAEQKRDPINHALFTSLKGSVYFDTIYQDSAKYFFETAFSEALKNTDYNSIYHSLYGLGKYYYRNSNFSASNKYFHTLNYYAEKNKNKYYQMAASYYLSANYNLLMSTSRTIHYARIASGFALQLKDTNNYIKAILALGGRYLVVNNIDSSDYYFKKAEEIYIPYSQKTHGIGADVYNSLLKSENVKKNYKKAIHYGKLAISDATQNNYPQNLNIYYDNISICYTEIKQFDSAIYFLEKAIELEKKFNYVDEYKEDLKELSRLHRLIGNNDKAFYYLGKFISADSLYKQDNNIIIDSLKTAFELEKSNLVFTVEKEKIQSQFEQKKKIIF